MVKDTELRKGNLLILNVNYKEVIHRVDEIYTDEAKVISIEDAACFPCMSLRTCKPIPLTPEWLERLGFESRREPDEPLIYSILKMDLDICLSDDGYYLYTNNTDPWHNRAVGRKIESVHHLQNIYLDLTGEELNVKL